MKKRGLNKRADFEHKIYFWMLNIIIIGLTWAALTTYVLSVSKLTLLEKNYFARDTALAINTLYAAPGNVEYTYEGDISKYKFMMSFFPNKVAITSKDQQEKVAVSYPFAEDRNMKFYYKENITFEADEKLKLVKEANEIKADKEIVMYEGKLVCPEINTKESISGKKVIIDAGHLTEQTDLGYEFSDKNEANLMLELAQKIKTLAPTKGLNAELTRETERTTEQRLNYINTEKPNIVISLHTNDDEKITIKTIVSSGANDETQKKSKKLGCIITNKILVNPELQEIEINTANPIAKEPKDHHGILVNNTISVIIEIGNVKFPELFKKTDSIAQSIVNAIDEYYTK